MSGRRATARPRTRIALGSHVGTHIDALCHFSCGGKLYGGRGRGGRPVLHRRPQRNSPSTRFRRFCGAACCSISPGCAWTDLSRATSKSPPDASGRGGGAQSVEIRRGRCGAAADRLGARIFADAAQFISEVHGPGPAIAGAGWLSRRGVYAAGSDTVAFEKVPDAGMPVHVHLLVESGIHIVECLNLEELAAARAYEFVFVAAPLKIRGATASPIRPVALV